MPITHVAYSDETHHNVGRFRGIALVSSEVERAMALRAVLQQALAESDVAEVKWVNLSTAKMRFAALKFVDTAVQHARRGSIRIDVLMWDTADSRHNVFGRDDVANLHRMHYHLLGNVLCNRWPDGAEWCLFPDEQGALHWAEIASFLQTRSTVLEVEQDIFSPHGLGLRLRQEFRIERITPTESHQEPLVQLADLFVGAGVYSRTSYDCYEQWQSAHTQQPGLFQDETPTRHLSRSDLERCRVLSRLDSLCKGHKLGVSLRTCRRLTTKNPKNPINFWWYEPQHEFDRAPVKGRR